MKSRNYLLLGFSLICFAYTISACQIMKMGAFALSKNHGIPKFNPQEIANNPNSIYSFERGTQEIQDLIANAIADFSYREKPYFKNKRQKITIQFEQFLKTKTTTNAFLVIKNDTLLYEKYFRGYDQNSLLNSFSISKSFTSALVGIAIEEGYIKSEKDLVINYLPELKNIVDKRWRQLTLEHLLNMRSGLGFKEDYRKAYGDVSDLISGKNAMEIVLRTEFDAFPGTKWRYNNLDAQILGIVVERATNQSLSNYLEQKIWTKIGAQQPAEWSIDSKKYQNTKAFCCMNISALDYARFGRLYLNYGNWNGVQIIPKDWIQKSIAPKRRTRYSYQWWNRNTRSLKRVDADSGMKLTFSDSLQAVEYIQDPILESVIKNRVEHTWHIMKTKPEFYARGAFGQFLLIIPEKGLIIIRLGQKEDFNGRSMREIGRFISDLVD